MKPVDFEYPSRMDCGQIYHLRIIFLCLSLFVYDPTLANEEDKKSFHNLDSHKSEWNLICSGNSKDFATQSVQTLRFAVSALSNRGKKTIVIDRLDRDSQWIITTEEKSTKVEGDLTISIDASDHGITWSRTHSRADFVDKWTGRITSGTKAIAMNFESLLNGKKVGGTEFAGLCASKV